MICFVDCQNCNGDGKRFVLIVPVTIVATAHATSKTRIEAVPRSNREVVRARGASGVTAVLGVETAIVRAARPQRSPLLTLYHYRAGHWPSSTKSRRYAVESSYLPASAETNR